MKIKPVDSILSKPMDRREFLAYTGTAALAATGVAGLLKVLETSPNQTTRTSGYGASAYGGSAEAE